MKTLLETCPSSIDATNTGAARVEDMGRVLIVNLKPCGHVTKHNDQGTYADHYQRFHLVLKSNQHCFQTCGNEPRGSRWEMSGGLNNKQVHCPQRGIQNVYTLFLIALLLRNSSANC